MKQFFLILTLGLGFISGAGAQENRGYCGTTIADQAQYTARLQDNIAKAKSGTLVHERGAVQYVPIYFHLVGDANGDGKHKERLVLDQLCEMNEFYAATEMRFYLKPHPTYGLFDYTINNNNVYNTQTNTILMQSRRNQSAINVYVVNEPGNSNNQPGQVLGYYNPGTDWLVMRKTEVNGNGNGTLNHEMGHFFSLRHPHYGWENNPFDPTDPTWPIAPTFSPPEPYGAILTEFVNGSNCSTAADLLCDTPADYCFGYGWPNGNCVYTLGAKDPMGVQVDPMENNIMGYFIGCDYVFTPSQITTMLADREASDRNYLDNNFTPASEEITTPSTDEFLVAPANGATTPYYDEVLLEWNAVPGATYYLIEMDWLNTYNTGNYRSYIVAGTSKLLTDLDDNRQYFWRVRPFNEYATCAAARQRNFKTSTTSGSREIEALSALQIAPNPASGDAPVRLFVQAADNFEASVLLLDATGRQVRALGNTVFAAGETTVDLPTAGLADGLYFVAIENAEGRVVRKMTIIR